MGRNIFTVSDEKKGGIEHYQKYPFPLNEKTSRVMRANKSKNSNPELLFRKNLWKNGIRGYRLNWKKLTGKPDVCFTKKKIAVFIHGCFWHRCPQCKPNFPNANKQYWELKFKKNVERDIKNKNELERQGWKVLIFWECEIYKNIEDCINTIKACIDETC